MQKIIYLIFFLLCNTVLFGQSVEQKTKSIIKEVKKINKDTSECTTKIHPGTNLTTLKGFYKDNQWKKIVNRKDLIQGYNVTEYYFLDDKLIFVLEKENDWDPQKGGSAKPTPMNSISMRVKNVYEGKYYFWNEQMFAQRITDERGHITGVIVDNANKEKFILDSAKDFIEQLKSIR